MGLMEIKKVEGQCWQIKTKKELVVVNPSEEYLRDKKFGGRIVIYTSQQENGVRYGEDGIVKIAGGGEYEIGGVEVVGISGGEKERVYTLAADGIVVGILGNLKEMLSDKKKERINSVDVLVFDIDEKEGITEKEIIKLAKDWGANYLIPMATGKDSVKLKKFLDETDNEGLEEVEVLKVERESLPEGVEVVLLK